jgi:hypothetical protein
MQYCRRRLAAHEIDHELLWLLISVSACLALLLWLSAGLATPRCGFRALTGLPCLTCGATRSAWQFLHGQFVTSMRFNPLAFVAYCGIAIFDLYALAVLIARAPRLRLNNFTRGEKLAARIVVVALLSANWLYLLLARPF